jgi:hypothetical protein
MASNGTGGVMVFEASDGVRAAKFDGTHLDPTPLLIAPGGTSPRIVFDGVQYWVAYLDASGVINVGTADSMGQFQSVASDVTAKHDAFELALVNGAVWTVGASSGGIEARQFCLD